MAERDRRTERRLRYLEDEIHASQARVKYHTERMADLERERAELLGPEETPAAGPGSSGGLGDLLKSLTPETIKQVGEAMQGIDLKPILGALGGGGAGPLLGALSGALGGGGLGGAALGGGAASGGVAGGIPATGGTGLSTLMGAVAGPAGTPLEGISEVMAFLNDHPLKGRKLNVQDALAGMKLLQSPNVRALLGTVGPLTSLFRGGAKPASGRGAGAAAEVAVATPAPSAETRASDQPVKFRYLRSENSPAVVEPWVGGASGRWVWVGESGKA